MSKMRLIFAVLHCGKNKLEALVEDESAGRRRRITVTWRTAMSTDVPPPNWVEMLQHECDFRYTRERMEAEGKILPGF